MNKRILAKPFISRRFIAPSRLHREAVAQQPRVIHTIHLHNIQPSHLPTRPYYPTQTLPIHVNIRVLSLTSLLVKVSKWPKASISRFIAEIVLLSSNTALRKSHSLFFQPLLTPHLAFLTWVRSLIIRPSMIATRFTIDLTSEYTEEKLPSPIHTTAKNFNNMLICTSTSSTQKPSLSTKHCCTCS